LENGRFDFKSNLSNPSLFLIETSPSSSSRQSDCSDITIEKLRLLSFEVKNFKLSDLLGQESLKAIKKVNT
jgi:hypothetical protein